MIDFELKNSLIETINSINIEYYGFIECRKFIELREYLMIKSKNSHFTEFEKSDIEERINPFLYFGNGKSIISIAVPYLRNDTYNESFSKYTQGLDYHFIVNGYLEKIGEVLKKFGYDFRCFCDTNNLPERYIAYLSGVGTIGKNSLIYTEKYGSYVFLGEIITDAVISENFSEGYYEEKFKNISKFSECGKCFNCIKKCPNNVLIEKNFNKCVSNLTQKKKLDLEEQDNLNGMIFGCDVCQYSCPRNRNVEFSFEKLFDVQKFIEKIDDEDIIFMNNKFFKENFKKLSCSWRGKNLLKRNAIIKNKDNLDFIRSLDLSNSEYLNYYRNQILMNNRKK